jgi:hypothetical protein
MVHRSKIRCTEQLPAIEPRLTPAAAIVLFRASQESLVVAENQPAVTGVNFAIAIDRECLSMCTMADGTVGGQPLLHSARFPPAPHPCDRGNRNDDSSR